MLRRYLTPWRIAIYGLIVVPALIYTLYLWSITGRDAAPPATGPTAAPAGYVSQAEFGAAWPLTVVDGVLACRDQAVTFTTNGTGYAVNGTAKTSTTLPDIDGIWIDDPSTGAKRDIAPLIERGLALCA